jgi:antitoxin PrlF
MNATATLTSKGQVTIPQAIREALGLDAGARLHFVLENGELRVVPLGSKTWGDLWSTAHGVPRQPGPVDVDAAIQEAIRARSHR